MGSVRQMCSQSIGVNEVTFSSAGFIPACFGTLLRDRFSYFLKLRPERSGPNQKIIKSETITIASKIANAQE